MENIENNKNNQNNDKEPNFLLDMLEKIKPLTGEYMKRLQSSLNENNESSDNSGESNSEEFVDSQNDTNSAINNVFEMLGSMFQNMNKYKEKTHLAFMPQIFLALSKTVYDNEIGESVRENSLKLCEMLKEKGEGYNIELLYDCELFKQHVLNLSIGFQKLAIYAVKNQLEKLEEELNGLNCETSVDALLINIYEKFNKKGKQ